MSPPIDRDPPDLSGCLAHDERRAQEVQQLVPPAQGVVVGDRLAVRLVLPNGYLVVGEADAIAGGPLMRARWSVIAERDRDRIAGVINQAEVARRR